MVVSLTVNSSEEFWSIDGVSLHQFGWSAATVGGARYDLPPRRGENIKLAYRIGTIHRPKLPDSRIVNLVMWVTGTDPATGLSTGDSRLRFNDSWDFLRRLVWKPNGAQVTLTRRWWLTVSGVPTLVSADAKAEIADTMTPTMTGRHRADFTMTLLLADPYFYGNQVTVNLPKGTPVSVNNPGHDTAGSSNFQVDLIGPLTNPVLTNATPTPNVWAKYGAVIPSGQTVTLDIPTFQATAVGTSPGNVIGFISHSGSRNLMGLAQNANLLTLTADSGTGSAVVRYRPPYA